MGEDERSSDGITGNNATATRQPTRAAPSRGWRHGRDCVGATGAPRHPDGPLGERPRTKPRSTPPTPTSRVNGSTTPSPLANEACATRGASSATSTSAKNETSRAVIVGPVYRVRRGGGHDRGTRSENDAKRINRRLRASCIRLRQAPSQWRGRLRYSRTNKISSYSIGRSGGRHSSPMRLYADAAS